MKILENAIFSLIDGDEITAKKNLHSWYVGIARKIHESLHDEMDMVISKHDQVTVKKAQRRINDAIAEEESLNDYVGDVSANIEPNTDYIRLLEDLKFNLPETIEEFNQVKQKIERVISSDWNFDRKILERLFVDLSNILGFGLMEEEDLGEPEEFDSDEAQEEIDAEEYYGE